MIIEQPEEKQKAIRDVLENCKAELKQIIGQPVSVTFRLVVNGITKEHIIHVVCRHFNTTISEIVADDRRRDVTVPRQILCWCLDKYNGLKHGIISDIIHRERSIVSRTIKKVDEMIETNDDLYLPHIEMIEKKILAIQMQKQ